MLRRRVAEALGGRARGGREVPHARAAVLALHYQLAGQEAEALAHFRSALGGPGDLARVEHKLGNLYGRRGEWKLAESPSSGA